ncbi:hypothetical protein M231_02233 [Tremella mesenterica]|uniref:Uncharacterized protein n=1 Tax=Tremella mesenterica TaxID=5217 RepID=A0A4Q1BR65_TREME|nr:uncharacterized protein TREMEDRAFT_70146 [Tremella mesenterica DSM 1558]EIW66581.1 hypothetical protein TREMEDRAFT_70146 [Tremella mesenterica DSM 1558]RXK40400.1 hypothetical protein M231_02233 [Tremella mesenterica]
MVNPVSSGKMAPQNGIQSAVLWKLILFAILMAVVPIGTYFSSLRFLFDGSTTFSAIAAIIAANIVLVGYVIIAFREDSQLSHPPIPLEKKSS